MLKHNLKKALSQATIAFVVLFAALALYMPSAQAETPTFTLPYRAENRWVHMEDNKSLNDLTNYAAKEQIYSFQVILPESTETNLYIERLLVLSRIMKGRLKRDSIVFRQDLGQTPANTIRVTPLEEDKVEDH